MSYYDPSTGYCASSLRPSFPTNGLPNSRSFLRTVRPVPDRHHCDRWYWRGRGCDGLTRSQRLAAIIVPSICFPLLCLVVLFAIWRIRVLRARVNAVEGRQLVTEGAVGALEEQHKKVHRHRRHSHSRHAYDTPYPYSYPPLGIHPHYYRPQHHRYHGGGCDRKYIGYY
jgi:hypothetical protein